MPQYSIEARSLSIVGGVAGHDFWVLRDESGKALAELHGLATDRKTNEFVPIGTDEERHSLRIWHFPHDPHYARTHGEAVTTDSFIREGQTFNTVLTSEKNEVLGRWNAAIDAVDKLNALDINYPNYGFRLLGQTVNSNSAYRTLGEIMGVQVKDFPGRLEPGIESRMISSEEIEKLRNHTFPVLDKPRIDEPARAKPSPGQPSQNEYPLKTSLGDDTPESKSHLDTLIDRLYQGAIDKDDAAMKSVTQDYMRSPMGQQFQQEVGLYKQSLQLQEQQAALEAQQQLLAQQLQEPIRRGPVMRM